MVVRKSLIQEKVQPIDIEALIDKGAAVKQDKKSQEKEWIHINLGIPSIMLKKIDECVEQTPGITRAGWIREAIREKLS